MSRKSIALIHLDNAIKKKEIQVYYQPIYNTMTEKLYPQKRWSAGIRRKTVRFCPGKFIPALEESGYISRLDEYVHLCIQDFLEQRNAAGLPLVKIAMNLVPHGFDEPAFNGYDFNKRFRIEIPGRLF